jgi:hypothetical protein
MPIHQLMVKNKVNIFFQGHDHLYAREELDGLVYQTVPMPSDSSYNLGMIANADAFGGVKLAGSGHLKVTVSPEKIQVDYILAVLTRDENSIMKNRQVANSYSVTPSGITSATEIPDMLTRQSIWAWPNPFLDSVEIQFVLQKPDKVSIQIFDNSGKLVDRIEPGILPPGKNTIRWDAVKRNEKPFRKGLYTCLVVTSEGKFSQKLILH